MSPWEPGTEHLSDVKIPDGHLKGVALWAFLLLVLVTSLAWVLWLLE